MATVVTRRRVGAFTVVMQTLPEAMAWGLVAHLIYNRWAAIFGYLPGWPYDYSVYGVVNFLLAEVVPAEWVPLTLGFLALVALVILGIKFFPLISAAWDRKMLTTIVALCVFGLTLGLSEAFYYGLTKGDLFFSPNLIINVVPALVVITIIIAGRGSRVVFAETGARGVEVLDSHGGQDQDPHGDLRA